MKKNTPKQQSNAAQEQHGNADARKQEKGGKDHQQPKKDDWCNRLFEILKQVGKWLICPLTWFYGLQPIEKFTAVLCAIGCMQVWTFVASERPFVSVSQVQFAGGDLKADVPLTFIMSVKNSGHTTAFVVDSRNIVRTQPSLPLDAGLKSLMLPTTAKGPIVAGDTNSIISRAIAGNGKPIILGKTAVDQLTISGEQHLWVIGYITYKDVFARFLGYSTTGYCFIYNPNPADPGLGHFDRCGDEEYEYAN